MCCRTIDEGGEDNERGQNNDDNTLPVSPSQSVKAPTDPHHEEPSPAFDQPQSASSEGSHVSPAVVTKPAARWSSAVRKVNFNRSTGKLARLHITQNYNHSATAGAEIAGGEGDSTTDAQSAAEQFEISFRARALRSPTISTYSDLKKKLTNCSKEWILNFLQANGLGILLQSLGKLSEKNSPCFVDTFIQLECVACVRAVMNSQSGLDYIIENPDFTRKFATGKNNSNNESNY